MNSVVVHYQEIALKGRNRPWFIERLTANLRGALADLDVRAVRPVMGRMEVMLGPTARWEDVRERLSTVFGLANFSKAGRVSSDLDVLTAAIIDDLAGREAPASFRIASRRADKRYPIASPEIERRVGAAVQRATGWKVDLSNPALVIHIEVLTDQAFYFFGKIPGPGGLPTGVSGRVACLMSGGIDSPVAVYRMMRRGCRAQLIHFHSYPFLSNASQEKVRELARILTRYQQRTRLYQVAFGEVQRQVVLSVPAPLRVVIYRRLMLRIAERMARWEGARALVTGESLGQVASQTLENMTVIGSATPMAVLRPLVGMDKEEVVAQAQRIGTYPVSIIPDQDCCQLFTPRNPSTRATIEEIDAAESALPMADLVEMAVKSASVELFKFPVVESPDRPAAGGPAGEESREEPYGL